MNPAPTAPALLDRPSSFAFAALSARASAAPARSLPRPPGPASDIPGVGTTSFSFYRSSGASALDFVRPALISARLVVVEEARVLPAQRQNGYKFVFVQRGRYRCTLNGRQLLLQTHDLLVVKRGDWHGEFLAAGGHHLTVNFNLLGGDHSPAADILFGDNAAPEHQIVRGPNDDIRQLLERMRDESRQDDSFLSLVENALLTQVFCRVARSLPPDRLSPVFLARSGAQIFSERLQRLFEQHVGENLCATELAAKMGVSVRTLTKRCQEITGRPPARAFKHYKMDYAARELRQSDAPIKDLSHRLGFQNQYHFSRVFRQFLGIAPSRYREQARVNRPPEG